ncbi:MAG: hypothetical protein EOS07_25945 [Mesorhizobium sp.]|uniref:hypothetical protein n=1 Tax=Mesorhizobium sp. TaxID=1871066 RepID=UPI000FE32A61|nr:hypothetical protein [Mesorhizobium sp.]RWC02523.1 MAG: hypothetical protein EOQ56_11890 [Mesorhizobium sp.]RWO05323.1 MAG: hypothetical protein EOS07_25945 [Mesorhizobium sp.]RWO18652.1 MAG: hypothetical protein EOS08_24280 [Mesorhizobium sp.]RWP06951.1 MAG: hypothetical protein EOQ99_10800 [Mesorhizobium sp.]RWP16260.1 MAG: hypothetical protein EOR01_27990 [Mesorhizobium sp.]
MEQKRTIAPFIGGMYGGLAALALAFGFRFLMIADPDPSSQATIAFSGLAFSICFSLAFLREHRRQIAAAREFLSRPRSYQD